MFLGETVYFELLSTFKKLSYQIQIARVIDLAKKKLQYKYRNCNTGIFTF